MDNQEQFELEVILQTLTEAKTDLERMVKGYTKARLKGLKDQSGYVPGPRKGPFQGLKPRKGTKTLPGGSK